MTSLATAFVQVRPDMTGFGARLSTSTSTAANTAGTDAGRSFTSRFGGALKIGALLGGAFAAAKITDFAHGAYTEAVEAQKVTALTEAVVKSTGGAANVSAAQVSNLANALSQKIGVDDEAIQAGENMLLTFCLEQSAQALTRNGWVHHHELRAGDEILSLDPDTGSACWEVVDSMHRFAVDGDLIRWKSKQIDVATTPHHRWWTVGSSGAGQYEPKFMTTEQISGKQVYVQIGGGLPAGFAGEATYSDDLIELAAWVHSEGWFPKWTDQSRGRKSRPCAMCNQPARNLAGPARCDDHGKRPIQTGRTQPAAKVTAETARHYGVGLCQSETANPLEVKRIRALVDRLRLHGHKITETTSVAAYNGSTMIQWHFASDLGHTIREMLPSKKLTYGLIQSMTSEQAATFLDVAIAGDGHVDSHGHEQFIQKDVEQLDVIAALAAMLGRRTTMLGRGDSIYFPTTNRLTGSATNATFEHYEGIVWCPAIRTGIFMARNNGRTFWTGNTNVRNEVGKNNDIFNQATVTVQDMAAAFGGDATSNSKILGKALNDPVKGVSALTRVGVSFTEQQKTQIAAMVKTGDTLGAQKIILGELSKETKGAAESQATSGAKMTVAWENFKEVVGTALMPVITKAMDYITEHVIPGFYKFAAVVREDILPVLRDWADWIKATVMPRIRELVGFVEDHLPEISATTKRVFGDVRGVVQSALGFVEQVVRTVTKVVSYVWTRWGEEIVATVRRLLGDAVFFIRSQLDLVKTIFKLGMDILKGNWGAAWDDVKNIFSNRWDLIKRVVDLGWDAIKKIFGTAFSYIRDSARTEWELFTNVVSGAMGKVSDVVKTGALWIVDKFLAMAEGIVGAAASAFSWVPGIGDKLKGAQDAIANFRAKVNAELSAIDDEAVNINVVTSQTRIDKVAAQLGSPGSYGGAGRGLPAAAVMNRMPAMGGAGLTFKTNAPTGKMHEIATDAQDYAHAAAVAVGEKLKALIPAGIMGQAGRALPRGSYSIGMPYLGYPGHYGADYPGDTGTPVWTPWAGRVAASYDIPGTSPYNNFPYTSYGRLVDVDHGNGTMSRFAHLFRRMVGVGQTLRAGQQVGEMGEMGNATGPHLHYEFHRNGATVNPASLGIFDQGGWLKNIGVNMGKKPEAVLSPRQSEAFVRLAKVADRPSGPMRIEGQLSIDERGQAWIRGIARDEVDAQGAFAGTIGRQR